MSIGSLPRLRMADVCEPNMDVPASGEPAQEQGVLQARTPRDWIWESLMDTIQMHKSVASSAAV